MSARIDVWEGDITKLDVDAIVNAANETLLGGGGVDGAIHRGAGPALLEACRALPEFAPGLRCRTGEAVLTPGFALRARHVIHTVGPVWHGGTAGEPTLLARCHREALALAQSRGIGSIAFPAISCGVYGFPLAAAAKVAMEATRAYLDAQPLPRRVLFCTFDAAATHAFRAACDAVDNTKCGGAVS